MDTTLTPMCSESLPKEFEKSTEILPLSGYGLSSVEQLRKAEKEVQDLEWLKGAGLSNEEIKLYQDNERGLLNQRHKIESGVLKEKLEVIYNKINSYQDEPCSSKSSDVMPSTSTAAEEVSEKHNKKSHKIYPPGHPMNDIKELEESLFGHLKSDIIPITKRRKILRRLARKSERILSQANRLDIGTVHSEKVNRAGSLWDLKELPKIGKRSKSASSKIVGPKNSTRYTIRDNKIVKVESVREKNSGESNRNFEADDEALRNNQEGQTMAEGMQMSVDDIRKIERFKDYEPGIPSKVLYLKNIAPTVTHDQLSLLFNQFVFENGGPIDLRLLTGRMRGQAFASFRMEHLAILALDEINGTILAGRPIIAQFGRNSNRIQAEEDR